MAEPQIESHRRKPADVFAGFCAAVVRRLPFGLSSVVAPSLLGYAIINSFTFGVDLLLLTLFLDVVGLAQWLSISIGYVVAFGLGFVLNRNMNFRSHAPVGRQLVLYVIAVVINYLVLVLGVTTGLTALGLPVQVARIIAAGCEAIFLYCVLRWVVFARRSEPTVGTDEN